MADRGGKGWRMAGAGEKGQVVLTREQWAALRAEAFKRAAARGSAKPDTSEVLREAVDAWMKRKR